MVLPASPDEWRDLWSTRGEPVPIASDLTESGSASGRRGDLGLPRRLSGVVLSVTDVARRASRNVASLDRWLRAWRVLAMLQGLAAAGSAARRAFAAADRSGFSTFRWARLWVTLRRSGADERAPPLGGR